MLKTLLTVVLCALLFLPFAAQDYLGWDTLPDPETLIDDLPYMGEVNDFSGGVQTGDLCPDFTVYDLNGNPTTLYDELRPDKYTILVSMSQSCIRVIQGLDLNYSPGTVNFIDEFGDQFNWVPIYVDEAHPADVENCPSNCTGTVFLSLDGDSIFSHQTYGERQLLAQELAFFGNSPSYTFTYPWNELYMDNPDNSVLVEVFQAPFAMVVLDCAGNVILTEPFMNNYLNDTNNWTNLTSLAEQGDSDNEDICNIREEFIGTDPFDPCDPDDTDTDGDGTCDNQEIRNGTDPCVDENSVGIEEAILPQIAAYPNPIKDLLLLTADRPVAQVDVLASSGQLVTSVRNQTVLDSSDWSSGVYTLRVLTTDDQQAVLRVIK